MYFEINACYSIGVFIKVSIFQILHILEKSYYTVSPEHFDVWYQWRHHVAYHKALPYLINTSSNSNQFWVECSQTQHVCKMSWPFPCSWHFKTHTHLKDCVSTFPSAQNLWSICNTAPWNTRLNSFKMKYLLSISGSWQHSHTFSSGNTHSTLNSCLCWCSLCYVFNSNFNNKRFTIRNKIRLIKHCFFPQMPF